MQLPQHHVHALRNRLLSLSLSVGLCAATAHVAYYNTKKLPVNIFGMKFETLLFFGKENTRPTRHAGLAPFCGLSLRLVQLLSVHSRQLGQVRST